MFLEFANNNGNKYIRVVESVRVTVDGKRVTRKKTIKNIGPVSRFTDGKPDYESRLKDSFIAGHPLIPALIPYVSKAQPLEKYSFQITEGSPECIGHPKLFSHILLEKILEDLEVIQVLNSYKGFSKIQYDLLGYFRLLVFGRILNPASKIATTSQNDTYYEPIIDDPYKFHVYDTLDFIYNHKAQIFNRLNSVISRDFKRKTDLVYYDVTNFFFEIDDPDDDILDDQNNVIKKGTRKCGVSKENRKEPIVQMGLFMDNSGIPISYQIFPGNTLDHQTVRSALKSTVDNMDFGRFIFVGDRGMCTYTNLLHITSLGNGYIVSKSIAKNKEKERQWIYDDNDYIVVSENFKYKSKVVTRTETDESGKKTTISEKVVVYWDKYFYDRQVKESKSFLDFLDELMESPNSFRITATQSKQIRKFLKKEYISSDTGELIQSSKLKTMIDEDKVNEYKKQFGYYQIVSSEIQMSDREIIDKYHGLSRIEDQFRVLKGDMSARPVYVKTEEHIDAHLAICTIALIIMRIIQNRIVESGKISVPAEGWSYGMSAERVQEALRKWTVDMLPNDLYRFNNIDNPDLKIILDAFSIDIPTKLYRRRELKGIKKTIKTSN